MPRCKPKRTMAEVKAAAAARRAMIADFRKSGLTYQAIADQIGVCESRARYLATADA